MGKVLCGMRVGEEVRHTGHIVAQGLEFGLGFPGCPKRQRDLLGLVGQLSDLGHLVPARSLPGKKRGSRERAHLSTDPNLPLLS